MTHLTVLSDCCSLLSINFLRNIWAAPAKNMSPDPARADYFVCQMQMVIGEARVPANLSVKQTRLSPFKYALLRINPQKMCPLGPHNAMQMMAPFKINGFKNQLCFFSSYFVLNIRFQDDLLQVTFQTAPHCSGPKREV